MFTLLEAVWVSAGVAAPVQWPSSDKCPPALTFLWVFLISCCVRQISPLDRSNASTLIELPPVHSPAI
ncbi:hypothetical protein J4Q44_G00166790 [Coregonus suidteri]|uniref:Uncharacterized protein n=1 Tax=Coregonus suidteri TaxID=861788 RepID=A0AAN8LRY0_9TELE